MKKHLAQFKDHAAHLGMKISVISASWVRASALCTDDPETWRLEFDYGVFGESNKVIQFSWYVGLGSKFYTHKMLLDRFLTFTRSDLHDMIHMIEAANQEFARAKALLSQIPANLKNELKVFVQ